MVFKKTVRKAFNELTRGVTYPVSYPVDNSYTIGIELGKLITLKFDGKTKNTYGELEDAITWQIADGTKDTMKPMGVVYETSAKDPRGAITEESLEVFYPVGVGVETGKLDITKEFVIEWYDDEDASKLYYNTKRVALTGTVTVDTVTDAKAVVGIGTAFTTELTVGDYIVVEDEVRQVANIVDDTTLSVVDVFKVNHSGVFAYKDSMIGKKVYATTNGDFTHIIPVGQTEADAIGEILSGKHVYINLK